MIRLPLNTDFIDIHSHHTEISRDIFRVFNVFLQNVSAVNYPGPLSIGLHPWHLDKWDEPGNLMEKLYHACSSENVIFIGEAGLDKIKNPDMDFQSEIFKTHIHISEKLKKPLVIHCVRAYEELLSIYKQENPAQVWINHGFDSSPEMAVDLVKKGIYISLGERLLKKKEKAEKILHSVPLSMIFIETDDGGSTIDDLYEQVSIMKNIEVKELKSYLLGNFLKITCS